MITRRLAFLFIFFSGSLLATPTSLFWTVCTTDIEKEGEMLLEIDNYFTVFNRRGRGSFLSPDIGMLFGLFNWNGLGGEAGFDYLGGTDDPLFFNAKIGVQEGWMFESAPGFCVGIFNIGTRSRGNYPTDMNVVDLVFGKTLPCIVGGGQLFLGAFSGSRALRPENQGIMVGYRHGFFQKIDEESGEKYYPWYFLADWSSGKNVLGGGGFSVQYCFNPDICLQTGPIWFNDTHINGSWKWSVLLGINIPLCPRPQK